jgi:peptide/nickel transport system substrate-binding protein
MGLHTSREKSDRGGALRPSGRRASVAFALIVALACGGPEPGSPVADGEHASSKVTLLIEADERLFGPYWSIDAWFLMFLPLATYDADGEITARLARSWERSEDGRVWTLHLRSDVRWHDGIPVTARDVEFSIDLAGHPDVLFDNAWYDVDSMSVRNDTTLTIFYGRPRDARDTWIVYWPKHLLEGLDPAEFYNWDFWTEPVGNGPYRYVRHIPQTMVELEANPDFYAGEPTIDELVIQFGGGNGIIEILSGNVDILTNVNSTDLPKIAADPRFEVHHFMFPEIPWLLTIRWNHERPGLDDARVRQALTHAIDRRELSALLNLPGDVRLVDVPFTGRQYRRSELPPPLAFDQELARRLLDEAGWTDEDGDGVREKAGSPFEFEAIVVQGGYESQAAVYVQEALGEVGVQMHVQTLQNNVLRARVGEGDFDAVFTPLFNHVDGHLGLLGGGSIYESVGAGPAGIPGYRNPDVTRLLLSAKETVDPASIDSIYRALWPFIQADLPITVLHPQAQTYVVHRRIQGLEGPFRSDPIRFMEFLRVEEPPQN